MKKLGSLRFFQPGKFKSSVWVMGTPMLRGSQVAGLLMWTLSHCADLPGKSSVDMLFPDCQRAALEPRQPQSGPPEGWTRGQIGVPYYGAL